MERVQHAAKELGLQPGLVGQLPAKWHRLGSVVLLRDDPCWSVDDGTRALVGQAYAQGLEAAAVGTIVGPVQGETRHPTVRRIFGPPTVTEHVEDGIVYVFDPTEAMFSPGNMAERMRMGALQAKDQIVVDLFAGIGYFTLPLLVRAGAGHVHACDLSRRALDWLWQAAARNGVEERLTTHEGNSHEVAPAGVADRVIAGNFGDSQEFLEPALACLRSGEEGTIHLHDVVQRGQEEAWTAQLAEVVAAHGAGLVQLSQQRVKSISPGHEHRVADLVVRP